jgi:hypothetical protein
MSAKDARSFVKSEIFRGIVGFATLILLLYAVMAPRISM